LKEANRMPGHEADILVKRYGGSRLYNAVDACYVDLNDIAVFVRQGLRVEARDARTGADISAEVAAQTLAGRQTLAM
jgi:polyhydroxyalkanoate synthesis regulator protein